jgi:hypothetical protein
MFIWSMRFEVLMAVTMGITIFWNGMLCTFERYVVPLFSGKVSRRFTVKMETAGSSKSR